VLAVKKWTDDWRWPPCQPVPVWYSLKDVAFALQLNWQYYWEPFQVALTITGCDRSLLATEGCRKDGAATCLFWEFCSCFRLVFIPLYAPPPSTNLCCRPSTNYSGSACPLIPLNPLLTFNHVFSLLIKGNVCSFAQPLITLNCHHNKPSFFIQTTFTQAYTHIHTHLPTHTYTHNTHRNFTFKCHRDNQDIYAVNSMEFNPGFGTFATAGSDGCYHFWDKDSKQRLKAQARSMYGTTPATPAPIPCRCVCVCVCARTYIRMWASCVCMHVQLNQSLVPGKFKMSYKLAVLNYEFFLGWWLTAVRTTGVAWSTRTPSATTGAEGMLSTTHKPWRTQSCCTAWRKTNAKQSQKCRESRALVFCYLPVQLTGWRLGL